MELRVQVFFSVTREGNSGSMMKHFEACSKGAGMESTERQFFIQTIERGIIATRLICLGTAGDAESTHMRGKKAIGQMKSTHMRATKAIGRGGI